MNIKAKPLMSLFIAAAFLLSFSFIATSTVSAKSQYNTCKDAIIAANKKANKKPIKDNQFKEGSTYQCPNAKGASIVFSTKSKKQKYNPPSSSDSSSPGSTTSGPSTNPSTNVSVEQKAKCKGGSFFSFPTWYQYLDCDPSGGISQTQSGSLPVLIILAVIDILLVLAGFAAVVYGMYGGFKLIISQGQPDGIAKGRTTILNATVGLVIAILASQIVSFIASKLTS